MATVSLHRKCALILLGITTVAFTVILEVPKFTLIGIAIVYVLSGFTLLFRACRLQPN